MQSVCCLDNIQAAVLDYRLTRMPHYIKRRRHIAKCYREGLNDLENVICPPNDRNDGGKNLDVYQNFEIRTENREQLKRHLDECEIETMVPWGGRAVHHLTAFTGAKNHLKNADLVFAQNLYLPMYVTLKHDEVDFIISSIRSFYLS